MLDVLADNLVIVGYVIFPSAGFERFTQLQDLYHHRLLGLVPFGRARYENASQITTKKDCHEDTK